MSQINILVLFYSLTGHTAALAKAVAQGATSLPNVTVQLKRVPELIPVDVFKKNTKLGNAQKKLEAEFPLATIDDLLKADGVAFGTPVHFGSFASQIKQFLDQLSPVWLKGELVNKPAAVFCSGASLHGGEEMTLLSLLIPLLNLGMIPVGLPYGQHGNAVSSFDAASPYGAVYVSGTDGALPFTDDHRQAAEALGKRLAQLTKTVQCSCDICVN